MVIGLAGFLLSQTISSSSMTYRQYGGTFGGICEYRQIRYRQEERDMAMTDTFVRNVKFSGAAAGDKHTDGGAMYLLVKESGKYWRMNYRFAGKRKTLALGVYPAVSLAKARQRRDKARELLADGVDPGTAKRDEKLAAAMAHANTFELVSREFCATKAGVWSPGYAEKWLRGMVKDLFPYIGSKPLAEISAPVLLATIRRAESRGAHETAHTLRQTAGQVFRYGIQTGRCDRNPAADLQGALKPAVVRHMAAMLDPVEVGKLMRAIQSYGGQPTTRTALILSALLFQRPGNIRQMEWAWIDFDRALLTIPSHDMKRRVHQKINGRPHLVPLAPQAINALKELHPLTGEGRFVFPSLITRQRPISDNTVNLALRRMGISGSPEFPTTSSKRSSRTASLDRWAVPTTAQNSWNSAAT
jgi:integrase